MARDTLTGGSFNHLSERTQLRPRTDEVQQGDGGVGNGCNINVVWKRCIAERLPHRTGRARCSAGRCGRGGQADDSENEMDGFRMHASKGDGGTFSKRHDHLIRRSSKIPVLCLGPWHPSTLRSGSWPGREGGGTVGGAPSGGGKFGLTLGCCKARVVGWKKGAQRAYLPKPVGSLSLSVISSIDHLERGATSRALAAQSNHDDCYQTPRRIHAVARRCASCCQCSHPSDGLEYVGACNPPEEHRRY